MKRKHPLLITCSIMLVGTAMTIYPFVSNFVYEKQQEKMIQSMEQTGLESSSLASEKEAADRYNRYLLEENIVLTDPFDPTAFADQLEIGYEDILNMYGNGMMGYLEIPAIDLSLAIYHGTSASVLSEGVGHLENSSLPVGGESTHAVLSAHTGLSDKKLFTDLVLLEEGDTFYIHVLDEVLAYEIDQILVVSPDETQDLQIVAGRDLVTLVTCTPYGVNSHRLLVRGTRIPLTEEEQEEKKTVHWFESSWMRQYLIAAASGTALAVLLLAVGAYFDRRERIHE